MPDSHPHDRHHAPPHPERRGWGWGGAAALVGVLAVVGLAAWLATGVYSVRHNERAVVQRCGRVLPGLRGPGLHVGLPYGIDRVLRLKVFETKRVAVGMTWGERALGRKIDPQQAETLTGDRNLIVVSAVVHYTLRYDPADERAAETLAAYLFRAADVPGLVRSKAAAALTAVIATMPVDDVITVGREAIRKQVRRRVQADLDRHGVEVQVTGVLLEELAPPQQVADAFRDVTSARADMEKAQREAEGYRNRVIPQARGEAYRTTAEAGAYARESVEKATGDARRFEQIAAEATRGRDLTARRLILETVEEVLPRLNKVILDGQARQGLDLGLIEPGD